MKNAGLRLTVASSAKKKELKELLHVCGADEFIESSTSSDDADESKPDPDIIHAASNGSVSPPAKSFSWAIRPMTWKRQRGRMKAVALRCGGWGDADLAGATAVYDNPADLLDHFVESPFDRRHGKREP